MKLSEQVGLILADHAELWASEQGIPIPARDTDEWQAMYEAWCDYAFADFGKGQEKEE